MLVLLHFADYQVLLLLVKNKTKNPTFILEEKELIIFITWEGYVEFPNFLKVKQ